MPERRAKLMDVSSDGPGCVFPAIRKAKHESGGPRFCNGRFVSGVLEA